MRPPPCRLAREAEAAGKIPPVRPRSQVFPASHPPCRVRLAGRGAAVKAGDSQGSAMALNRSKEHTSELQSLMRISYAVFCLKKKKYKKIKHCYSQKHKTQ